MMRRTQQSRRDHVPYTLAIIVTLLLLLLAVFTSSHIAIASSDVESDGSCALSKIEENTTTEPTTVSAATGPGIFDRVKQFIQTTKNLVLDTTSSERNLVIDDCCCVAKDVEKATREHLGPLLNKLVRRTFFKLFKVNLFKECPFWAVQVMCGLSGGCGVCECDANEIPVPWRIEMTDRVDRTLPKKFPHWQDEQESLWFQRDEDNSDISYVNLLLNPEVNSGYVGEDAWRIWRAIYFENCWREPLSDMCLEQRVFYRLISGLHTSISTHIAAYFYQNKPNTGKPGAPVDTSNGNGNGNGNEPMLEELFLPNVEEFDRRVGSHPDRIQNMYFTFTFVLRALNKIRDFLVAYDFNTGNPVEDQKTQAMVRELLDLPLLCSPTFDESVLFAQPETAPLKEQMRSHFRNISMIMDCVACEKCRLWGKLQTLGLGTALKIVLEDKDISAVTSTLQRNEIIALVNLLRQLANSIQNVENLRTMSWRTKASPYISYMMVGAFALFICVQLLRTCFSTTEEDRETTAVSAKKQNKKKSE